MISSGQSTFAQGHAGLNRLTVHIPTNSKVLYGHRLRLNASSEDKAHQHPGHESLSDPEATYKRYGQNFGKPYLLDVVENAPRIRVRRAHDRARDQLADLAVLNERLALQSEAEATAARQRVEYLKRRRRNWELVYQTVMREDALCTLAAIEEANSKVEKALSEESRERTGVGKLKRQLQELQAEVAAAHSRLHLTQARVETNLRRINQLKEEAVALTRVPTSDGAEAGVAATAEVSAAGEGVSSAVLPMKRPLKGKGLQSSLDLEDELKNHWFAVHFSSRLTKDTLVPIELFDEPWVLFRDAEGRAACVRDECAHRACPLSLGSVVNGQVQCAYHGWKFNAEGTCTDMPSTAFCKGVAVTALPVVEVDGLVWVWPGWREAGPLPYGLASPPPGFQVHAEIDMEVPVEHGLLVENLLDLAHAPFTHTTTFARGWPVPEVVQFHAARMLSGRWQPYPIDMEFRPPCITMSMIGLAAPGKVERGAVAADCKNHLHQVHICLPARRGHTRLLYRMSMDFMGWVRFVPGITNIWKRVAAQVLGEDLVLVVGQQERLRRGGDTWAHPVSYDKLAVRYRRWRNSVGAAGGGGAGLGREGTQQGSVLRMNAEELFAVEDDEDGVYVDQNGLQ